MSEQVERRTLELCAKAVGGSLASCNRRLLWSTLVLLVTICLPMFGVDAPVSSELSPRKLVGANGHALRYWSFSVVAVQGSVQVRVKFEETDVVYPVLSVAKPTEPGFKVEHVLRG